MATESKRRKKFVAPLLPAMLVKEKVKNPDKVMATESKRRKEFVAPLLPAMLVKEKVKRKPTAASSPQKLKKLQMTKCCEPEKSVNDADSTIHFSSLSQPLAIAKKVKSKVIKSDKKNSVTRAQVPALLEVNLSNKNDPESSISNKTESGLEMPALLEVNEVNLSNKNDHESNISNKTESGLENPIDMDAVSSSDLLQYASSPKDEFSKCGEKTCTSHKLMKEKVVNGKVSLDLGNANNIAQNENKSVEFTVETTISNEIICDVNEQSAEVKLGNYHIDSLQCTENLLSEHDIRQCNGNIQQGTPTKLNIAIDPITNTSTILQSSQTEICNQAKFEKKATPQKKLSQSFLDILNTVCTTKQDCLVVTTEHNANNNINSEDGINKLLTKLGSQEELKMQNRNTKQNASSETHESYVKEETSDGEFSDIVGNSQDDGTYPTLQLTINNSLKAHDNQDTFKVDIPQICSSELSCTQTTFLVSPNKIKQMTKGNNANKNVSVVAENNCNTGDSVCEDNNFSCNFSHLLLKQEIELQDETSTLDCNQDDKNEVLPDRNLKDETQQNGKDNKNKLIPDRKLKDETKENDDMDGKNELILDRKLNDEKPQKCDNDEQEKFQQEPIQWEHETFFKEVNISDVANAEQPGCKTQTKSEICATDTVQQNIVLESIATTSSLVANLDDDLEISTSQLLELENEFSSMATQRHNPELCQSEPTTAIRSLLPRQIRAPTVDWTQRAQHNRQRLQSIIQDICKLNALLARARKMMWKQ